MKSATQRIIARVRKTYSTTNLLRLKIWQTILIGAGLGMSVSASAQSSGNAAIVGLCKMTSFVSDTLAIAVFGIAMAMMGVLYTMDAAREGVMAVAVRILLGAGVAMGALTLTVFLLGKGVC